jgi:phage shock protein PspC (stress-responsive transcriptional regulator)
MHAGDQTFYRGSDRILGGVCSGLAAGLHVDAIWIRVAFVLLAFLQGVGAFIYIVLWLVMPEKQEAGPPQSGFDSMAADLKRVGRELQAQFGGLVGARPGGSQADAPTPGAVAAPPPPPPPPPPGPPAVSGSRGSQTLILGLLLVIGGVTLLAANMRLVTWGVIWPALIIVLGVILLIRTLERRA